MGRISYRSVQHWKWNLNLGKNTVADFARKIAPTLIHWPIWRANMPMPESLAGRPLLLEVIFFSIAVDQQKAIEALETQWRH